MPRRGLDAIVWTACRPGWLTCPSSSEPPTFAAIVGLRDPSSMALEPDPLERRASVGRLRDLRYLVLRA